MALAARCPCWLQSGGAVPLSDENLIINELIREYLNFNQYQETLSVLVPGI